MYCLNGHYVGLLNEVRQARTGAQWQRMMAQAEREGPTRLPLFCSTCGAANINACQHCQTPIELQYLDARPAYCGGCGKPHPWQESAIENLKGILQESELNAEDRQEIELALHDVLRDTPKTESASLRMKRLLGKMRKPLYDVAIKVVTDVASETAKKTLGVK
jgi:hypothetical protein